MTAAVDLTGKDYDDLHVERFVESRQVRERKRRIYLCKCKCGNFKEVCGDDLTRRSVKSCGCRRKRYGDKNPKWRGCGEISGNLWDNIRRKDRGLDFTITIEQAWDLFEKQKGKCALSGVKLEFGKNRTASLDRIDSSRGYHIDNVQWVHKDINIMKNVYSQERFIEVCLSVAKWRKKCQPSTSS